MPSVTLPSALTRVFKRGPPDEDEDLAAAKGEIEKLEERWGGLAVSVGKVGSARRGECFSCILRTGRVKERLIGCECNSYRNGRSRHRRKVDLVSDG